MKPEVKLIKKILKKEFPHQTFSVQLRQAKDYSCSGDIVYVRCKMYLVEQVRKALETNTRCCSIGVKASRYPVLSKAWNADVAYIYDVDINEFVQPDKTMLDFIIICPLI